MPADGRVVLVTGGASGLGAAIVSALSAVGATPVCLDLQAPTGDCDHEQVDLARPRDGEAAVARAIDRHGRLDGVVTAAGTDACGGLEAVPAEAWERVIAVNLVGTAAVVRAELPALRETHGRVVTVASTLGLRALPDATAYCASKFGVVGVTRALAAELGDEVGVTMLVPGGMRTSFFDGREEQYRPPDDARLNDPADVARAVLLAFDLPPGCELRELVVAPAGDGSWPP
jgi:NAD(P)-dependent dehydrogenase (short-subunit alcohol dehydrogenase family)